jgi:hypothetical protein
VDTSGFLSRYTGLTLIKLFTALKLFPAGIRKLPAGYVFPFSDNASVVRSTSSFSFNATKAAL